MVSAKDQHGRTAHLTEWHACLVAHRDPPCPHTLLPWEVDMVHQATSQYLRSLNPGSTALQVANFHLGGLFCVLYLDLGFTTACETRYAVWPLRCTSYNTLYSSSTRIEFT